MRFTDGTQPTVDGLEAMPHKADCAGVKLRALLADAGPQGEPQPFMLPTPEPAMPSTMGEEWRALNELENSVTLLRTLYRKVVTDQMLMDALEVAFDKLAAVERARQR